MSCLYCSIPTRLDVRKTAPNRATIDHIVPISRGGTSAESNLAVACNACNVEKANKTLEEFVQLKQKGFVGS